ncbi:MAG TPA: hypothetical protein VFW02_00615, partial [Candidatus Limnocylindrales bacterium]|nr:hypothetical protein [Candidatus Limnocylindrales bacterium]
MTTFRPLTDATLEAMLARRAARADPVGLLPQISAAVERTAQAVRPVFARPDWVARFRASLRPIWVVVVVGLLVALLAAITLLGTRPPDRPPLPLRYGATLETLTPGGNDYWSGATDVDGSVWAWSPGHLTRIEAASGAVRTWTISDDEAFASAGIAAARDAGVWVIGKDALRRFDGDAFRTVIDAPGMAAG